MNQDIMQQTIRNISSSGVGNGILAVFIVAVVSLILYQVLSYSKFKESNMTKALKMLVMKLKGPLIATILLVIGFTTIDLLYYYLPQIFNTRFGEIFINVIPYFERFLIFVMFLWFAAGLLNFLEEWLLQTTYFNRSPLTQILFPLLEDGVRAAVLVLVINMLIPELGLIGTPFIILQKLGHILLILTLGWVFYQIINAGEKIILIQYSVEQMNDPTGRKIRTQVILLKRIFISLLLIIIIAAILLIFDNVRKLGAGLLTTAGILGALGAFASQQSLSRLFGGLQIAFTQPIRIGDNVIINGESGEIEQITLSYVTVKLWDLRRLIIPTDAITSQNLQNLSRGQLQLLGTIFFYVDYTLPVQMVREKFLELIKESNWWDKKIASFNVSEIKESSMELRALVSAIDSNTLWNLRCEIREKLMTYIASTFPECLPCTRQRVGK